MANTFWVVTKPNRVSELGDICFACTYKQLMIQARGGLHEKEIVGIYADEAEAKQMAVKLLGRNIVRTSDAMHRRSAGEYPVTPTKRNMTARALAGQPSKRSAMPSVKPRRKDSSTGWRDQVAMGMGEVGLEPPDAFRVSCIVARFEDLWSS